MRCTPTNPLKVGARTPPQPRPRYFSPGSPAALLYAGRFLRRNGLTTEGLAVACHYAWSENPHRVGEINLDVEVPGLTAEKREAFMRVIEHCTLHNTLLRPPEVRLKLVAAETMTAE